MAADQMGGTLQPGEILNNTYIIEELIAVGGTGEVYRARNRASDREIAIKILRREFAGNQTFLDLMRREASVLHEVQDDAVVRYYDILHSEAHGGFIFLVMEFIRGASLAEVMKRGPVDEATCLTVARRVAQGLKASHDKKAYHRDLSPDNVILRDGDPARAVLIDFGIAKDVNEDARTVIGGGFAGKYQYAAPEQIDGRADGRSDLYSLGMTLIGAARGRAPIAAASYLEIIRTKGAKPDISDLPGRLRALVDRLVDPDPARRLQTPDDVLAFLGAGPAGTGPGTPPPGTAPVRVPQTRKGPGAGLWVGLVILLAALGGGGWYFGLGPGREMVFGPEFPVADPYRMEILMAGPGRMRVTGNAPSPEAAAAVMSALSSLNGGTIPEGGVEAATGMPTPGWQSALLAIARSAGPLPVWWLAASGTAVELAGEAPDDATRASVVAAAMAAAQEGGLSLTESIQVPKPPLLVADLQREVNAFATCGALSVAGGDGRAIPEEGQVVISGRIAKPEEQGLIGEAVKPLTGSRPVSFDLRVLSVPVCRLLGTLPALSDPSLALVYGYGDKEGLAPGDAYSGNENPVIDLALPATLTGHVHAFYADFEGQVFHLIPHNNRQMHDLGQIGTVQNGIRRVRLTWPESEASVEQLGFRVSEPYGTGIVVAVLTDRPLFPGLRPRAESFDAFFDEYTRALNGRGARFAWRFLVTEP